ncbi:hypothetical protein D3C85_1480870 [compost metagenome]
MNAGSCNSNTPNIGKANSTNKAARLPSSQGCCSMACKLPPNSAASTPRLA